MSDGLGMRSRKPAGQWAAIDAMRAKTTLMSTPETVEPVFLGRIDKPMAFPLCHAIATDAFAFRVIWESRWHNQCAHEIRFTFRLDKTFACVRNVLRWVGDMAGKDVTFGRERRMKFGQRVAVGKHA